VKTLFINPSLRPESKVRILPVGLAYVMSALHRGFFDFDLYDMDVHKYTLEDLRKYVRFHRGEYDIYAFGCIVTGYKLVKQISGIIKEEDPGALVVVGNSVGSSIPEILLNTTDVDFVIRGEGDIALVRLLNLMSISGKELFKDQPVWELHPIDDLDSIPFPEWSLFDVEKYFEYEADVCVKAERPFYINTARGCSFNCSFCYHVFKDYKFRRYSPNLVVLEIEKLQKQYKIDFITFHDDFTFASKRDVKEFLKELEALKEPIRWYAVCRAGLFTWMDLGLLQEMKEKGCVSLSFSLENGDKGILKQMNKKISVKAFMEQAETLWKAGIIPGTSVIFGYPTETEKTIKKTIDVCRECNIYPSVGYLLPLPGTAVYQFAREYGYIKDEVRYLNNIGDRQDIHINMTQMPTKDFVATVEGELEQLAKEQGLELDNYIKTSHYQKPKGERNIG